MRFSLYDVSCYDAGMHQYSHNHADVAQTCSRCLVAYPQLVSFHVLTTVTVFGVACIFSYVSLRFEVAKRNEVVVLRLTFWLMLQVRGKAFLTISEEKYFGWKAKGVRFV